MKTVLMMGMLLALAGCVGPFGVADQKVYDCQGKDGDYELWAIVSKMRVVNYADYGHQELQLTMDRATKDRSKDTYITESVPIEKATSAKKNEFVQRAKKFCGTR